MEIEIEILERKISAYESTYSSKEKEIIISRLNSILARHIKKTSKISELLGINLGNPEKDVQKIKAFLAREKRAYSDIDWNELPEDIKFMIQIMQITLI